MIWGLDEFADWLFPPDKSECTATTLDLLATGYPAFRFRRERVGLRGQRWIAERKNGLDPGLHTLIINSLGGLLRALHRDRHAMEHAMHGKPDGSLAKLFREFGDRWEIENVQAGTEWIAVDRDTGGDYIRVISAHHIDTLRYRINQAELDEPEEREVADQCGR